MIIVLSKLYRGFIDDLFFGFRFFLFVYNIKWFKKYLYNLILNIIKYGIWEVILIKKWLRNMVLEKNSKR